MSQPTASFEPLLRRATLVCVLTAVVLFGACSQSGADTDHADGDAHAGETAKAKTAVAKEPGNAEEGGHAEEGALKLSAEEAQRAGIKVERASAQPLNETVVVTATIQPDQDRVARVAPRIEGRITSTTAKLGDRVRSGQRLAVLDSVEVGEAHAAHVQAQSELRITEADFKRAEQLDADEIIPRKDFLRARADRDKAAAALRASTDKLHLLGGNPNASGGSVASFAVTAPFAGSVIQKKATRGDLARPSDAMFTIADLSRVWIIADLPEAALARVRTGAKAQVSVPAYAGETFVGHVSYIGAALDRDTRTVAARIEVANADGRLKPEMFASATIEVANTEGTINAVQARSVISVPDEAIVLMQSQPTVFVLENGVYQPRTVEPGERAGGRTVIQSGIEPGEQVVTAGTYTLKARKQKSQLGHGH